MIRWFNLLLYCCIFLFCYLFSGFMRYICVEAHNLWICFVFLAFCHRSHRNFRRDEIILLLNLLRLTIVNTWSVKSRVIQKWMLVFRRRRLMIKLRLRFALYFNLVNSLNQRTAKRTLPLSTCMILQTTPAECMLTWGYLKSIAFFELFFKRFKTYWAFVLLRWLRRWFLQLFRDLCRLISIIAWFTLIYLKLIPSANNFIYLFITYLSL